MVGDKAETETKDDLHVSLKRKEKLSQEEKSHKSKRGQLKKEWVSYSISKITSTFPPKITETNFYIGTIN